MPARLLCYVSANGNRTAHACQLGSRAGARFTEWGFGVVKIKYQESADPVWTETAHARIVAGELVTRITTSADGSRTLYVDGECPRCPDNCDFSLSLEADVGLSQREVGSLVEKLNDESARSARFYTVRCNCSGHHDAPDSKRGCGAFFNVYAPSSEIAHHD